MENRPTSYREGNISMEKQILITGSKSYIGTSFQQYISKKNGNMPLHDQWHVTFVSVRNSEWKQMDFSKYDTILHVAGIVHRKETEDMKPLYEQVNRDLTLELAKKAKAEGVKQFIFLSTMSVYGVVTGKITEDTPLSPVNNYGRSKLEAEAGLQKLASEAFVVSIVRPPMIYGKDCTGNYALLSKLAKKIPVFPKVANERSMLYIDNLSEFLYRLADRRQGGIFCPQNRHYVNTSDMVARIAESYGKPMLLIPGFGWLIRLMAKKITLFAKVFGSLTYEQAMSFPETIGDYEVVDYEESIRMSGGKTSAN